MGGSNRPILFAIGGIVVGIGAGVAIGWFSKVRSGLFRRNITYRLYTVAWKQQKNLLARERHH